VPVEDKLLGRGPRNGSREPGNRSYELPDGKGETKCTAERQAEVPVRAQNAQETMPKHHERGGEPAEESASEDMRPSCR